MPKAIKKIFIIYTFVILNFFSLKNYNRLFVRIQNIDVFRVAFENVRDKVRLVGNCAVHRNDLSNGQGSKAIVETDSSAAEGIIGRLGASKKTKHFPVLWG